MLPRATRSGARLVLLAVVALAVSVSPGLTGEFFEGFEDGTLGQMEPMNIDAGLASLEASDGYRCQYSDPDNPDSNSYGQITDCWLGATEDQGNAFFWNVVDGEADGEEARSFSGRFSVWMGAIDEPRSSKGKKPNPDPFVRSLTAPMGTLEALVTAEPLYIGYDAPELSFKHQISLPDYRVVNTSGPLRSADGGVVQAQVVTPGGVPRGDWRTLVAYQNGYDQQREDNYTNCFFDPIDDGNTEDDFYDGSVRLGPSSLCYDQWVFAYLGDTDEAFNEANVGNSDGPGLEGENGLGTWVESRFDLSAYEGQRILIRFISSGIKAGTGETYEDIFMWNPTPADDGWFIDDITVTGTMDSSDELAADEADGSAPAGRGVQVLQARPMP